MELETRRLLLRPFVPEDLDDLYAMLGDEQTMFYLEPPYSRERTAAFLSEFCIARRGALAAQEKLSGRVVGYLLFCPVQAGEWELGWVFHRDFRRRGLAFEACSALMDWAFSRPETRRVWAETADPVKAAGLLKKLGMELVDVQYSAGSAGAELLVYERKKETIQRVL